MLRRRERPRLRLSRGSRVRHLPGSGIGLALVRTVARRLGGEVNLRARRVATPNFLGDGGRALLDRRWPGDGQARTREVTPPHVGGRSWRAFLTVVACWLENR